MDEIKPVTDESEKLEVAKRIANLYAMADWMMKDYGLDPDYVGHVYSEMKKNEEL